MAHFSKATKPPIAPCQYFTTMKLFVACAFAAVVSVTSGSICEVQPERQDATDCGEYYTCGTGKPRKEHCPGKLAFNPKNGICDWADLVESCDVEVYMNFECPDNIDEQAGQSWAFPYPGDCAKQFVCVPSATEDYKRVPRLLSCDDPEVFDPETRKCLYYKEVKGCEDYYKRPKKVPKPVAADDEISAGAIPDKRIVSRNPTARPVPEVRRTVTTAKPTVVTRKAAVKTTAAPKTTTTLSPEEYDYEDEQ